MPTFLFSTVLLTFVFVFQEVESMSDTQHFCLRWNNYQSSITSAFESLRDQDDFVDVTLACEGRSLKAHRVVLSACSPYFRELLKVSPNTSSPADSVDLASYSPYYWSLPWRLRQTSPYSPNFSLDEIFDSNLWATGYITCRQKIIQMAACIVFVTENWARDKGNRVHFHTRLIEKNVYCLFTSKTLCRNTRRYMIRGPVIHTGFPIVMWNTYVQDREIFMK